MSNADARGTLPAAVTVPGGIAFAQFRFFVGQVTVPTPVTLTARLGASAASFDFVVHPPSLESLILPSSVPLDA